MDLRQVARDPGADSGLEMGVAAQFVDARCLLVGLVDAGSRRIETQDRLTAPKQNRDQQAKKRKYRPWTDQARRQCVLRLAVQ